MRLTRMGRSRLVELMGKTKEVNEKAEFTRKEVPAELLK